MTEKMLTGTYIIKSNVPLAQLQRNRAGECLHKSLAAAQESLSFGVPTWSDVNMPVCCMRERVSLCLTYCQHMRYIETVPGFRVSSNRNRTRNPWLQDEWFIHYTTTEGAQ